MLLLFSCVANAGEGLLKAVQTELKLHGKDFHPLPNLSAFDCNINGAIATFTRKRDNEDIVVTLDANSAVELDSMGGDFSAEEEVSLLQLLWATTHLCIVYKEEEGGIIMAPVFSVTITKPSVSLNCKV